MGVPSPSSFPLGRGSLKPLQESVTESHLGPCSLGHGVCDSSVRPAGCVPRVLGTLVPVGAATGSLLQVSVGWGTQLHGCVLARGWELWSRGAFVGCWDVPDPTRRHCGTGLSRSPTALLFQIHLLWRSPRQPVRSPCRLSAPGLMPEADFSPCGSLRSPRRDPPLGLSLSGTPVVPPVLALQPQGG